MLRSRKSVLATTIVALAFLGLLVSPATAHADDIVITGGYVSVGGAAFSRNAWSGIGFNFSGDGFAASGGQGDGLTQEVMSPCRFDPCPAGSIVFPNVRAHLDGVGLATFNGMTLPAWWFGRDSILLFNGPAVTIPDSTAPFVTVTAPFTMTGSVLIRPLEGDPDRPVIFTTTISGSGIATLRFTNIPQLGTGYIFSDVQYDFAPVPEPGTLSLIGGGLTGLLALYRRRRRDS